LKSIYVICFRTIFSPYYSHVYNSINATKTAK